MIELNQPVDMNGVDIPIGTGCLYDEQGNEHEVQEWVYNQTTGKWSFKSEGSDGYDPGLFCVSKPAGGNSRKRLLQDLRIAEFTARNDGMWCCAYLGRGYFHCDGCPADDNCAGYVISDIAARVRAVFGGEQDA